MYWETPTLDVHLHAFCPAQELEDDESEEEIVPEPDREDAEIMGRSHGRAWIIGVEEMVVSCGFHGHGGTPNGCFLFEGKSENPSING